MNFIIYIKCNLFQNELLGKNDAYSYRFMSTCSCTLCGAKNTNKTTCPLNKDSTSVSKHSIPQSGGALIEVTLKGMSGSPWMIKMGQIEESKSIGDIKRKFNAITHTAFEYTHITHRGRSIKNDVRLGTLTDSSIMMHVSVMSSGYPMFEDEEGDPAINVTIKNAVLQSPVIGLKIMNPMTTVAKIKEIITKKFTGDFPEIDILYRDTGGIRKLDDLEAIGYLGTGREGLDFKDTQFIELMWMFKITKAHLYSKTSKVS